MKRQAERPPKVRSAFKSTNSERANRKRFDAQARTRPGYPQNPSKLWCSGVLASGVVGGMRRMAFFLGFFMDDGEMRLLCPKSR